MTTGQSLTLVVPDELYERLRQSADLTERSIAEEALEAVAMALPTAVDLSPATTQLLSQLTVLPDDDLWRMAEHTLSRREDRRLRLLAGRREDGVITASEGQELEGLLERLDDVGLIRAKATALLYERGHDVSALVPR